MNWQTLNSQETLEQLIEKSKEQPVLIFKHSTRCSISSMALNRIERSWQNEVIVPYFLDLIRYRDVSNAIVDKLGVAHQSPQAIVLKDGKVVYHNSHMGINTHEIESFA